MIPLRWLVLPALLASLPSACNSDEADRARGEELLFKVKLDGARRALVEIKQRSSQNKSIYADCKTVRMLFLVDLKKHESEEAQRLATDLLKACQQANPSELESSP